MAAPNCAADVKIQLTTVPRQTVQTKDNVSVEVDSVISWHVVSPYRAAYGINNLAVALVERARKCYSPFRCSLPQQLWEV